MKSFFVGIVLLCSSMTAFAATATPSVLFVERAQHAKIKAVKHRPGYLQIQLKQLNPVAVYFTDQPVRKSGRLSVKQLTQVLNAHMKKGLRPNLVIEGLQLNGEESSYVLTLSAVHQQHHALFYIAQLEGKASLAKADLKQVSIFIDNIPGPNPFLP